MLKQEEVEKLLSMPKKLTAVTSIQFPILDEYIELDANSVDESERFIFDVSRKGRFKLLKCTYQERYLKTEALLRLDVDGPPHTNPDGQRIECPHLHIYREDFGDRWAIPAPPNLVIANDLVRTLKNFLSYAKVVEIPRIQRGIN
ncbi:MAG: hypothetical protein CMJ46_13515 [Planctomyces sp.]|nr:hypothetical protein [Planctomyces sp.]